MADLGAGHLSGLTEADPAWEAAWAPYDEATYQAALAALRPTDVVLDLGAGDLRFARQAARRCRRVIAIERRLPLLRAAGPWPANLWPVCADLRQWHWPPGVTVGVLLMRHCRRFAEYAAGLRAAGAGRLITNARWGLGVEVIDLEAPRRPFAEAAGRWYACACGAAGFAPGPPGALDEQALDQMVEVRACPRCEPP
ncbi:MAG: hypothetical protein JNK29_20190 [Anaerolineales bacterium]|nr:hypothetical protein [Anaerolineales bacterium]